MAKNFMSSILDELMGRDRDTGPSEETRKLSYDDPEICPHYMVIFCPHELFVNTKADLGPCHRIHDDVLRKKYYDEASGRLKNQYEGEFIRFGDKMIGDIEAKIKRGKQRIALANGDNGNFGVPGSKNYEKIQMLTERINVLIEEAEAAGCGGDVEKAQGLLKLCDTLKEEREQLNPNKPAESIPGQHQWNPDKLMQVCEVCGSYLIIGEAQHRLDDHIMGKQHMGFAQLRKTLEDVRVRRDAREKEERERFDREREKRRAASDRDWDRDSRRRSRSKEKSKDSPDKRDRKRDSSKEKSRHSDSDKKRRRSRSRDRKEKKRSRSRSRSGSRSSKHHKRDKEHRDRDKDKKSHKKDRDRDRDREKASEDKSTRNDAEKVEATATSTD